MARGRHRRRSGLLARLLPARRLPRSPRARRDAEAARLRALVEASAATASAALVRAAAAQDAATAAQLRALLAEAQLSSARKELVALRGDLAALREELVWAFAEGRMPVAAPAVIDLTRQATSAG